MEMRTADQCISFKTENEAKKEMEKIMHHKQLYVDALTVSDYIKNL